MLNHPRSRPKLYASQKRVASADQSRNDSIDIGHCSGWSVDFYPRWCLSTCPCLSILQPLHDTWQRCFNGWFRLHIYRPAEKFAHAREFRCKMSQRLYKFKVPSKLSRTLRLTQVLWLTSYLGAERTSLSLLAAAKDLRQRLSRLKSHSSSLMF